jgi:hypothetical protein
VTFAAAMSDDLQSPEDAFPKPVPPEPETKFWNFKKK